MIRVSLGTARVLGLNNKKCAVAPTTAYLLLGEKCLRSCGFCSRSRDSMSGADLLSRVTWPHYPVSEVVDRLDRAYQRGELHRVCLQVVHDREAWKQGMRVLESIKRSCQVPVSVSCTANSLDDIRNWFDAGAERFGLALDAASEKVFKTIKGGNWRQTLALLHGAANMWPGRISTHLIVGLGETDRETITRLREMIGINVRVGLFAFTPVKGTRMQRHTPPPLARYRCIQAAYYLLVKHKTGAGNFVYDEQGNLAGLGLPDEELAQVLTGGDAFRTSGCDMCNRPFYNERPGGDIYNYPRPLNEKEAAVAVQTVLNSEQRKTGTM